MDTKILLFFNFLVLVIVAHNSYVLVKQTEVMTDLVRILEQSRRLAVSQRSTDNQTNGTERGEGGQNSSTSNNGGPRDNNFGMINLLNNSGWLKINDNDNNNNNNNNINLPQTINLTNSTVVYQIVILNNNQNHNYN